MAGAVNNKHRLCTDTLAKFPILPYRPYDELPIRKHPCSLIFFALFLRKSLSLQINRTRANRNEFHLDNKKRYILDEKFKLSGAKSKSTLIRKPILYGYVYDMDYGFINNEFILFDGINQGRTCAAAGR